MLSLDITNGRLTIRPEDLTVASIARIWAWDKATGKPEAEKLLRYVYGMCESSKEKNPFADVSLQKREATVKKHVFGDADHALKGARLDMVQEAMADYVFLNENAETRALEAYDLQIDLMGDLLRAEENQPQIIKNTNITNGTVSFATNAEMILKIMTQIEKASESKDKLASRLANGRRGQSRLRRNAELSTSEKGVIGYDFSKAKKAAGRAQEGGEGA